MNFFLKKITLLGLLVFLTITCNNDDGDGGSEDPTAQNRLQLGISAEDLLSADTYKSMTVELVYSPAYRPTQATIDDFRLFLNERVNKPDGITFVETEIVDQNGPFSISQIRQIENEQRTQYTVGDDIAVYVYFASGSSNSDTETTVTLGTAYQNTSIVIYESTLIEVTNNVQETLTRLESTTLQHEFGHIFGLVNIQNDDIHPGDEHEDADNSKHCIIGDCLMYFEAQNIRRPILARQVARMGEDIEIAIFDPLCISDLQAKGGK